MIIKKSFEELEVGKQGGCSFSDVVIEIFNPHVELPPFNVMEAPRPYPQQHEERYALCITQVKINGPCGLSINYFNIVGIFLQSNAS